MKFFAFLFASMFSAYAYSQPVIIAHRGDNKYAPENSVEAAEIAWKNGIKFVECDIYETPAGMVCIHGKSELKSLTGCAKEISELTAEDLKNLNLADNAKWKEKYAIVRIPTLSDIMATVPSGGTLVLEMKSYSPSYAKKVDEAREAAGLEKEQVLLISFNAEAIKSFNARYKGYKSLWLYSVRFENGKYIPTPEEAVKKCREIGAAGVYVGNSGIIGADYIYSVKKTGMNFYVWTVNTRDEFRRLINLGVDGITTDFASDMAKIFAGYKKR